MRRLAVVAMAVLLGAAVALPVSAASSAFNGSWSSIDPVDGSAQHLSIKGSGGHVQMSYVDEFGSVCEDIGAPTTAFTGVLAGVVSGDVLVGTWKSAGCGPWLLLRATDHFDWIFEYDANTDTLFGATNDGPATWYRD